MKRANIRVIQQGDGTWHIVMTNEHGVVTDRISYGSRAKAREALKKAKRATIVVSLPTSELNNVQ